MNISSNPALVAEREQKLRALGSRPPWWRPFKRREWKRRRDAVLAMDVSEAAALMRVIYSKALLDEVVKLASPSYAMIGKAPSDGFHYKAVTYKPKPEDS